MISEMFVYRYRRKKKNDFKRKKLKFLKGPKGLVHGFCPKIELFLCGYFREIVSEKMVFDIAERKE